MPSRQAGQRGVGQPDKREGGARQEWERSLADKKEGTETHKHTKIRERERQGDNKGGRDHMGKGVPYLAHGPSPRPVLLLSLFACPMQGHWSRAPCLWVEPPNLTGFFHSPKFCMATSEAVISRFAKGSGVTGCVSH